MSSTSYDCNTNDTVFLNINEIAFFTTTDYPLLMSLEEFNICKLNFSLNSNSNTTFKLIIAFYEITSFDDGVASDIFFNVYNEFSYTLKNPFAHIDSIAQQGLILFENDNGVERCPMESISKENPFIFTDETQIFHIQSSYYLNFKRKISCKWQFFAPDGFGFKVVVMHFSVSSKTKFRISNTTVILANERSVETYHPYYNDDQLIYINLSADPNFVTRMEFQAYITVVKKNFAVKRQNCSTKIDYGEITLYEYGYENNFQCKYNLLIYENTEIIANYALLALERNMDFVKIIGANSSEILTESSLFVIRPNKMGFENEVAFEFISDGSLRSLGFEMHFKEIECGCSNYTISCDFFTFNIMDGTDYYCGNLNCTFKIEPCESDLILINFEINIVKSKNFIKDIFRVISNNAIVFEVNDYKMESLNYFIYVNSTNENIFEVITYPSEIVRSMSMHVVQSDAPVIDCFVKLSSVMPNYIIDTGLCNLISVEVDETPISQKNDFIIYSSIFDGVPLYNNQSLTLNIRNKNCFNNPNMYKCEISINKFVIFMQATGSLYPILAVRLKKIKQNGCIFAENIFSSNFSNIFPVDSISTSEDLCFITILLDDSYYISSLWTTPGNINVKVFFGADQSKFYFQFNSSSAKIWKNIRLYSPVITVKIPKNASLYLILRHDLYRTQPISNFPFKSLVTTPNFGVSKKTYNNYSDKHFISYAIGNVTVKFTAIYYNLTVEDEFYFCFNSEKLKINNTGETIAFRNQNITLGFIYERNKQVNNGVMLLIEAIKGDPFSIF